VAENKASTRKMGAGREETKETMNTKNHEGRRKRKICNNGPVR